MVIKTNPEFGIELALVVPYAYWLHENNQLDTVVTSKGMKPFYYFCSDVREEFTFRNIDNSAAGLNDLPNNWIHHNSFYLTGKDYGSLSNSEKFNINGVLDYSKWKCPPYKNKYKNDEFTFNRPVVFITNIFNHPDPADKRYYHHIPIKGLYDIFTLLNDMGYDVIYKRENNKNASITYDQNELLGKYNNSGIIANVESLGIISDYELVSYFSNVILFDDILKNNPHYGYNEIQLKILANCEKYISVCGGSSILTSCFEGTNIIYVTQGKELRDNYFGKNSYFRKLSNANIVPIIDNVDEIKFRGYHNTNKILDAIRQEF